MAQSMLPHAIGTDSLAAYLIRVQGDVDLVWLDYYQGISIVVSAPPGLPPTSTICTHDADQAAVFGILNSLFDFGFPLLSVERLEPTQPGIHPVTPHAQKVAASSFD